MATINPDRVLPPPPTRPPTRPRGRGTTLVTTTALVGAAAAVPAVLPGFDVGLLALWLPLIILAISIDLLWGENRIVSFGHGAFFAGGGYLAGLLLRGPAADTSGANLTLLSGQPTKKPLFDTVVHALGGPSVLGVPILAFLLPVVVCGVAGWLIGRVIFQVGSAEVYAPLITLGVGVIAMTMFLRTSQLGGSNGLSGIPRYTRDISQAADASNYYFNLGWVLAITLGYARFRASRHGRRWRAAGDDPIRLEALGARVPALRATGFAASAALAGLAGAIYVGTSGFVSASLADVTFSVQVLIWVAVGGTGSLAGPILGVLAVQFGQQYLSDRVHYYWQLILGIGLLVIVLTTPDGLAGAARTILRGLPPHAANGTGSGLPRVRARRPTYGDRYAPHPDRRPDQ